MWGSQIKTTPYKYHKNLSLKSSNSIYQQKTCFFEAIHIIIHLEKNPKLFQIIVSEKLFEYLTQAYAEADKIYSVCIYFYFYFIWLIEFLCYGKNSVNIE